MNKANILILLLIILFADVVKPQNINDTLKKHPVQLNIQYAGNVGFASIGIGTKFCRHKMYVGLIYGYLPKSAHEVEVHTIAIKYYYKYFSNSLAKRITTFLYMGTNINYSITHNTYLKYPKHFPERYYSTNAIHFAPFLGQSFDFSLRKSKLNKMSVYCELGTIDSYIADCITSNLVTVFDIYNLCVGISFSFL